MAFTYNGYKLVGAMYFVPFIDDCLRVSKLLNVINIFCNRLKE
jgi:hypothetical protein